MKQPTIASTPLVPGSMSDHTLCLLLRLGRAAFQQTDSRLSGLGLRVRHYSVLQALADRGPLPQNKLGKYLGIDAATMVACIDGLEQMRLVERHKDADDRRRYLVALTEEGERAVDQANLTITAAEDSALADLSAEDRAALLHLLQTINVAPSFIQPSGRT